MCFAILTALLLANGTARAAVFLLDGLSTTSFDETVTSSIVFNSNATQSVADVASGLSLFNSTSEWAYEFTITMNNGSRPLSRGSSGGRYSLINGGFIQLLFSGSFSNGTQPYDLAWTPVSGNSSGNTIPAADIFATGLSRNTAQTVGLHKHNPGSGDQIDIYFGGAIVKTVAPDATYFNGATDDVIRVKQNGSTEHLTATISFRGGAVSGTVPQIEVAGASNRDIDELTGMTQNTTGGGQIGSAINVTGAGTPGVDGVFDYTFASPISGAKVMRVTQNLAAQFNFTEMQVFNSSAVNVALNAEARSLNFLNLGGTNGGQAVQALDGIIDRNCCANMFHSNGSPGTGDWWEVEFDNAETITGFNLWGRSAFDGRNDNFNVTFYSAITGGESAAQLLDIAEYVFEIQDLTQFDQLTVSREQAFFDRVLDVNNASLLLKFSDSALLSPGDTFQILDVEQILGSFESITVEFLAGNPIGLDTSNLLIDGTISIAATALAVPEPSSIALGTCGLAGLLSLSICARRARRR